MSNQSVLPRRSRRLATIIPASHWISIGYSNEEAQAMEKLQNDMKKYCEDNDDEIELKGIRGRILPHHDMMLPHWQKLAKALQLERSNVERIDVFGISLPIPVLDIIFPALHLNNLEYILLVDVQLGSDGLLKLFSFVKAHTSIIEVAIGSDIIDDSVANSLLDTVKDHPTLVSLGLCTSGLNNADILRRVLNGCSGLREFRLGYEELGLESITITADFIRSNHPTENISMNQCSITDVETTLLATSLSHNTNLKDLDLSDNDITEEGEKSLLNALYDPTSMDSIVRSNHICNVYTYDIEDSSMVAMRPLLEREVININSDDDISIQQKIRKKVVLALCGVDGGVFDISHFNDLSLQLMPRVLELIQEHSRTRMKAVISMPDQLEKDALTRLFHALRGWELPLLFENLSGPSANGGGKKRKKRKKTRR